MTAMPTPAEINVRSTSPRKINDALRALVEYLGLAPATAVLLKYSRPTAFTPAMSMCHFNVWVQTIHNGGNVQPGWLLWEDPRIGFCEAEFHAVWVSPEGRLVDVTPRRDQEKRVMFVPDPTRTIRLTDIAGRPGIHTFENVQVLAGGLKNPLRPLTAAIEDVSFLHANGLWRPRDEPERTPNGLVGIPQGAIDL